jgi:hypothetical protein
MFGFGFRIQPIHEVLIWIKNNMPPLLGNKPMDLLSQQIIFFGNKLMGYARK